MAKSAQPRYLDGKALRRKRVAAGLEQAALAEMCGAKQHQVSGWENEYNGCRLGMLHKLARALGCKPEELMLADIKGDDSSDETEPDEVAA
jgi:transcriptional regulator with XRE-family HTH domain